MPEIYFDNAASTPLIAPMQQMFNPSSPHKLGLAADRALEGARQSLLHQTRAKRLIFTSGGTEALNLAILGFAIGNRGRNPTIFAQGTEHPAVTGPIKFAQELGFCQVKICPPDQWMSAGPALYCFTHICHETSHMPNILGLTTRLKAQNPDALVLVDGAQGFLKEQVPPYDIYTISAHKAHGPAGVGAVALAEGVRLMPTMHGGAHESSMRAGTQNVAGICCFAEAAKSLSKSFIARKAHVRQIYDTLAKLAQTLPGTYVNRLDGDFSPYILSLGFDGVKAETLVSMLSSRGVYAAFGAACRPRSKKSPLIDMGFSQERAESALRLSFSHLNTKREAEQACKAIVACVTELRLMGGY